MIELAVIILSEGPSLWDPRAPIKDEDVEDGFTPTDDDVSVAVRSTVSRGVRISYKAIVAARAVVTNDLPAGAILEGVLARISPEECRD